MTSGLDREALDDLELGDWRGSTRLRLRVKPGSRKAGLLGVHDGALKVAVVTAAERGKANKSVMKLLARALDLAPGDLELAAGQTSQDKVVLVPLVPAEIRRRLSAAAES